MGALKITSFQNPHAKEAQKLRNRKERKLSELFLIEGYRELKRYIDAQKTVLKLFFCPSLFLKTNERELVQKASEQNALVFECSEALFKKLSYRDRPDGLLAVANQFHDSLDQLELIDTPFLVIAESIEKPGNLGTILRTCDAAKVDAVIVCDPCTDIFNPNVVRSSIGTLFTQPVIQANFTETIAFLTKHQIRVVAATPHAKDSYVKTHLLGPVALLVGCEQYGLSENWFERAAVKVRIPMKGIADSLNVAQATTLLLYEILRQRDEL